MIGLQEGKHYGVGPVAEKGGHETLVITDAHDDGVHPKDAETVFVCLDCGLVVDDERRFVVEECDRESNPIPMTLREKGGL